MSKAFTRSELNAFVQSPLKARTTGGQPILQFVEHLEQFDDQHPTVLPPGPPDDLITKVQALPWSKLDPFAATIQTPISGDNLPLQLSVGKRSWKPATAPTSTDIFALGMHTFTNAFGGVENLYVGNSGSVFPDMPVVRGIGFNGQSMEGGFSIWTWSLDYTNNFASRTMAGKGRIKWSRPSTVFVVSFEFWVRWEFSINIPPWEGGISAAGIKPPRLVSPLADLDAGEWFDVPIPTGVIGDITNKPEAMFGMYNVPIFFETPEEWQTRTGLVFI